jgi:hypothetical protein
LGAVYHLGAVISIFLAILVLVKKEKMLSDIILGAWLTGSGLNLFIYHHHLLCSYFDSRSVILPLRSFSDNPKEQGKIEKPPAFYSCSDFSDLYIVSCCLRKSAKN